MKDQYDKEPSMVQLELKQILSWAGYKASWWCPKFGYMAWNSRLYFQSTHPTAKIWLQFDPPCLCRNPRLEIKIPGVDDFDLEAVAVWRLFRRAEDIALKYEKEVPE